MKDRDCGEEVYLYNEDKLIGIVTLYRGIQTLGVYRLYDGFDSVKIVKE